jgi:hypothetical protein
MRAFAIQMEKSSWDDTVAAAKLLGVDAPTFVRAALSQRLRGILKYDREKAARVKRGQA